MMAAVAAMVSEVFIDAMMGSFGVNLPDTHWTNVWMQIKTSNTHTKNCSISMDDLGTNPARVGVRDTGSRRT
jgi:hypothetical protein